MKDVWKVLTGGFLSGYRTEAAGVGIFLTGLISWLMGDITLAALGDNIQTMLAGLGVVGARGVIGELVKAVKAMTDAGVGKPPSA